MTSQELTPEQAEAMQKQLRPTLAYLGRMRDRMIEERFPHDDPLLQDVLKAHDAMQGLFVRLHYLSCRSGVGRAPR